MQWPLKQLDELGLVSRGKSKHRPRDAAHLYDGPYPFIQTGDVKAANFYITKYSQTYSEAGLKQSKLWKKGTLCITIAANIAETAILGIDACFPDSIIGFIADPNKACVKYIKYLINTLKQRYQSVSQGAAQSNLSQKKLLSIKFSVPPLEKQIEISHLLSSYDELIENNLRRIQLLEQAARLIYEEWFIRFRFPGHEQTKMVDGLPEGWIKVALNKICVDVREQTIPSKVSPDTPYIGLEHIPRKSITLDSWGNACDVESTKFKFSKRNILFGKIRPNLHKIGIAFVEGITSSDTIVIRSLDELYHNYLLFLLSGNEFVALASKTGREGSKMPRADWKFLSKHIFLLPSKNILNNFNTLIEPIIVQLENLAFSNQKLAKARDLLIPKLMNGEIQL